MNQIFTYLDYRKFLKDRFAFLKENRRNVTHRSLMKKAGFSSPNFLKLVMEGQRNLTEKSIPKIAHIMDLEGKAADFFSALVKFNQAKKVDEKDKAYEYLKSLRKDLAIRRLEHSQFDYYKDWYAIAIRELITLTKFQDDPEWISEKLERKVPPREIKKTLKLLEHLGMIHRDANKKLQQKEAHVTAGDVVSSLAVYRFHQIMIEKAIEALKQTPSSRRDITCITFALNQETFLEIKKRITKFRREILDLANQCEPKTSVYQLNFQLFNLSEAPWDQSSDG